MSMTLFAFLKYTVASACIKDSDVCSRLMWGSHMRGPNYLYSTCSVRCTPRGKDMNVMPFLPVMNARKICAGDATHNVSERPCRNILGTSAHIRSMLSFLSFGVHMSCSPPGFSTLGFGSGSSLLT